MKLAAIIRFSFWNFWFQCPKQNYGKRMWANWRKLTQMCRKCTWLQHYARSWHGLCDELFQPASVIDTCLNGYHGRDGFVNGPPKHLSGSMPNTELCFYFLNCKIHFEVHNMLSIKALSEVHARSRKIIISIFANVYLEKLAFECLKTGKTGWFIWIPACMTVWDNTNANEAPPVIFLFPVPAR